MKLSNSAAQVSTRLKTARDAEFLAAVADLEWARRSRARARWLSEKPSRLARRSVGRGDGFERRRSRGLFRNRPPSRIWWRNQGSILVISMHLVDACSPFAKAKRM